MRKKKCKSCKEWFIPDRQFQEGCKIECAIEIVEQKRERKRKKETARRKDGLKTLSELLGEAQKEFNTYIRLRDEGSPCISCGTTNNIKYNAGHYRSVGANPELRFEEDNVHLQCERCNSFLSGNIVEYRKKLLEKIGQDRLDWIEGPHEPKNYTKDDARRIKQEYRDKIKAIRRSDK